MTTTAANRLTLADDDVIIGEGVALSVRPAGFVIRAGSAAIDVVVTAIGLIATMIGAFALVNTYMAATGETVEGAWASVISVSVLVLWMVIVPATVETLSNGRSLGRLIFGLRIVRDDGGAIGFRHAFVRALTGVAEIWLTAGGIAVIVGLLNARAKRVGDLLAGTYSQLERLPTPRPLDLTMPPVLYRWAGIADASRLPDRVVRRIHDFFLQAPRLDSSARNRVAGELARSARPYVHPIPDVDAETFLMGVSVLRRDREYRAIIDRAARLERVAPVLERQPFGFPERG